MKYYSLKYYEPFSQENPTIKGLRKGYDYDSEKSVTNIWFYKKIDFIPDIDLVLNPKVKATDLLESLDISSDYLCVSKKFYEILKEYKLLEYQCFDAIIKDKKNTLNYYFLNFYFNLTCDDNYIIDLNKTKFLATGNKAFLEEFPNMEKEGVLGEFKIKSWSEFNSIRDKRENNDMHKTILPLDTLYIKDKEFLELDLFTLSLGNLGGSPAFEFVISEKLAKAILENGITGVEVELLPFDIKLS